MDLEILEARRTLSGRLLRIDNARFSLPVTGLHFWVAALLALMAIGFVFLGAGRLELGTDDARLGIAAGESLGPLGQVFGFWAPDLWPVRVAASQVARLFEEPGRSGPGCVLWPVALAGVGVGLLLARRMVRTLGPRAGLWFGLCWFGCLGLVDHSESTRMDLIAGLGTIAALDRLITFGSDWKAGLWGAYAFLAGGVPPLIVIALSVIVIGRREVRLTHRLLAPPIIAAVLWSIWTLSLAPAQAWAAALTIPFTERPDWWLAASVLVLGLPFSPWVLVAMSRELRVSWNEPGRALAASWAQIAVASLVAGTVIPGLSSAARVPALAGLLLVASTGLDGAWNKALSRPARHAFLGLTLALLAAWLVVVLYGSYIWMAVFPYYRPLGIAVALISLPAFALGWTAVEAGNSRRALIALVLITISLKLVHWGFYVPEWNYRFGQGPWGRAVGQWLLHDWTIHTFHDWPSDIAFAIGRPIRRLDSPQHLNFPASPEAKHVLLLESEFQEWPETAPKLHQVATFQDKSGSKRILARTDGYLRGPAGLILSREDRAEAR